MQSAAHGLRQLARPRHVLPSVASTSRVVQLEARRNASWFNNLGSISNPVNWVQEKLSPKVREQATQRQVEAARKEAAAKGELGVFETAAETIKDAPASTQVAKREKADHHKYSTANFKMSHRKLNDLGRQISGKPIDYAILQMQFSEKRASTRIKGMLATAKRHATNYKGLDSSKLIIAEAWVTKGPRSHKRIDIRGRGKFGIKVHPDSRMHVVLKEGKTWVERQEQERARKLGRIRSAGLVREDVPIRNPAPTWGW